MGGILCDREVQGSSTASRLEFERERQPQGGNVCIYKYIARERVEGSFLCRETTPTPYFHNPYFLVLVNNSLPRNICIQNICDQVFYTVFYIKIMAKANGYVYWLCMLAVITLAVSSLAVCNG